MLHTTYLSIRMLELTVRSQNCIANHLVNVIDLESESDMTYGQVW